MIDGDANSFFNDVDHDHVALWFRGTGYFFEGIAYCKDTDDYSFEIYNFLDDDLPDGGLIFNHQSKNPAECIEAFINAPIWDGLTFWEAEPEMSWIDTDFAEQDYAWAFIPGEEYEAQQARLTELFARPDWKDLRDKWLADRKAARQAAKKNQG